VKIKSTPQDFQVEERISLPIASRGAYAVYRLWKRGITTLEALQRLSRACRVPESEIRYGGKKDRQGETVQFVTVPSHRNLSYREGDLCSSLEGYAEEPMGPLWITENAFQLVLREIPSAGEAHAICEKAHEISRRGMPNYYDDQRFGAQGNTREFFAEKLLQGNPSEALKLYFTEIHPQAPQRVRRRSVFISRHWGDWRKIYPFCKKGLPLKVLSMLRQDDSPSGFWKGVNTLSGELLGIYISSFQSFLWNRLLGNYLFQGWQEEDLLCVSCALWSFPVGVSKKASFFLPEPCEIPSHAAETPPMEPNLYKLWIGVLKERSLSPEMFALPELQRAYFGSFQRPSLVFPRKMQAFVEPEESGKFQRVSLSFTLPRGSYATLLVKSIRIL